MRVRENLIPVASRAQWRYRVLVISRRSHDVSIFNVFNPFPDPGFAFARAGARRDRPAGLEGASGLAR